MEYKDFSQELWETFTKSIDQALEEVPKPWYAAFDADGTLWDVDAGNIFFDYEIQNNLLDLPQDPWKHVYAIKDQDPKKAFLWLAQIHKNQKLSDVREWAKKSFNAAENFNYFDPTLKIISYLQKKGVEIIIVTASVKWAVEPAAAKIGIPEENVVGVKTKIENGIISDIQDGAVTFKEGKSKALLERTKGVKPIFCMGNTMGDYFLLQDATHGRIAVHSALPEQKVYQSEQEFYAKAKELGWPTHSFR